MTDRFEGYHPVNTLPIQQGDKVRIRKGTRIFNRYSNARPREYEAGTTYSVTVNHVLCGTEPTSWHPDTKVENPKVCWAGPSGYWLEADINDVEKVVSA